MLGISKHVARVGLRQFCVPNSHTPKSKSTLTQKPAKVINESLKFQRLQEQLQKHDEKPIMLKGGRSRNICLATLGLCGLGLLTNINADKTAFAMN